MGCEIWQKTKRSQISFTRSYGYKLFLAMPCMCVTKCLFIYLFFTIFTVFFISIKCLFYHKNNKNMEM